MTTKKTKTKTSEPFTRTTRHLATIKLPYPPSLNQYYRTYNRRMVVSARGRAYREKVKGILGPAFQTTDTYSSPLRVWIEVMFPDKRKRDLDNLNKALLDAITHSDVWGDDSLIHDLRLVKVGVEKPGYVRLHIAEIVR